LTREATDEIRARIDLVDLIGAHVRLTKAGRSFKGLCPFHEEKTPSFHVNPERGMWHCFGCGEHGDCFTFLMRLETLSFPEALQRLADKAGVTLERRGRGPSRDQRDEMLSALASAARFYGECLQKSERAGQYVRKRAIDAETASKFGLGFAPEGWDNLAGFFAREKVDLGAAEKAGLVSRRRDGGYYDRFRNRLMFPVTDASDRVVGFGGRDLGTDGPKYLNSPETPVFRKGSTLYGFGLARKAIAAAGHVVLVEGYLDVISCHRAGIDNAVAAMGTASGEGHVALLKRVCDRAVLCFDMDSAGQKAALAASELFGAGGFDARVAVLPEGDDPDSLVASGRMADLIRALEGAVPAADYRLDALMASFDLREETERSRMLEKAVEMVARVPNVFERDRLIRKLVPYHADFRKGYGADRGEDSAETRIRQAVERMLPAGAKAARRMPSSAAQKPAGRSRTPLGATEKAERIILMALLQGGELADHAAARIAPDGFVGEVCRQLAAEIFRRREVGEDPASIPLAEGAPQTGEPAPGGEDMQQEQARRLASSLLVRGAGAPLTKPVLDDCVERVLAESRRRELSELQDLVKRGEITRDDPRFQEYLALMRRAHG